MKGAAPSADRFPTGRELAGALIATFFICAELWIILSVVFAPGRARAEDAVEMPIAASGGTPDSFIDFKVDQRVAVATITIREEIARSLNEGDCLRVTNHELVKVECDKPEIAPTCDAKASDLLCHRP